MADYLARAIGAGGNIRAFAVTTSDTVNEGRRRHDTWPTATAALGRALTGTLLLSATLKDKNESVTLRVDGDGPLGGITCDGDEQGNVRGHVRNPHVDLEQNAQGKFDVAGAVGDGFIHVTRQLDLEGIYTGTSEIISGEIGEDLAYYLTKSEQTPSAVALGVRVAPDGEVVAAGGYLIQLMPATNEDEREQLEVNIAAMGAVSSAIEEGRTPEEILASILAGIDYKVLERRDVQFQCRCSRERAIAVMATIDQDEVDQMIAEEQGAEMTCHFCNEVYRLSAEELQQARQEQH